MYIFQRGIIDQGIATKSTKCLQFSTKGITTIQGSGDSVKAHSIYCSIIISPEEVMPAGPTAA